MDFGGFILFGLLGAFTLFWLIFTLVSFDHRHPKRMFRLVVLGISTGMLLMFGLFLYKAYYLDEELVIASMKGDTGEVRALLARGADPNTKWEDGKTAVQEAQKSKHKDIVVLLKKDGAN
jgi:hypothetical protein